MTTPVSIRFSSMPTLGPVLTFQRPRTAAEARDFAARQNQREADRRARTISKEKARLAEIRRLAEDARRAKPRLSPTAARLTPAAIYAERKVTTTTSTTAPAPAPARRRPRTFSDLARERFGGADTNTPGTLIASSGRGGTDR